MPKLRNVAGPVVRGPDLWGRTNDVAQLWDLLQKGSVLLTGPRRHGKSSLMYAVYDKPLKGFVVILVDVEWVETPEEFLTTMIAELLAFDRVRQLFHQVSGIPSRITGWVANVIGEIGVGAGNVGELKIRLREQVGGGEGIFELAGQVLGILRKLEEQTVLILDEFPIMLGTMLAKDEASALRFLRWFRTFRQTPGTDRLTFLLGGSTNIEPRLESLGAEALLGDLQRFRIMPFKRNAAVEFVREILTEERTPFELGTPEAIVEICNSGVPYYLQVVISECSAETRRTEEALTAEKVRAIYDEQVIGPINRHRFSHYHTRLKYQYGALEEPARIILSQLSGGRKTTDELRLSIVSNGFVGADLERLLVLLEGDYYVIRDGQSVEFADGLLRDWWTRNSTPPKAR